MRKLVFVGMLVLAMGAGACTRKHQPARVRHDARATVDAAPAKPQAGPGDDRCGYVDRNGKPAIARRFHEAGEFSEGLAPVEALGKSGFIDAKAEYVIAPTFDAAKGFREGLAAVCLKGRGWGFIDKQGAWVISPRFAFADSFSEGVAVARADPDVEDVCDGLAGKRFVPGSECEWTAANEEPSDDPGQYYLIDRSGARLHEKGYHCITRMSEGLAAALQQDRWGFLDHLGKEAIPPRFFRVKPFGEGWAAFWEPDRGACLGGSGRWGFIDKRGRVRVRAKYRAREVGVLAQGLIAMEGLPLKTLLGSAVGKSCVLGQGQTAADLADNPWAEADCVAYLDKRGNIQVAVPYCSFDDVGPGLRTPREFQGEFVEMVMQQPMSVYPLRCAPALMRDVRVFFNRHGEMVSPVAALSSRNPAGLVPVCHRRRARLEVDRFTME